MVGGEHFCVAGKRTANKLHRAQLVCDESAGSAALTIASTRAASEEHDLVRVLERLGEMLGHQRHHLERFHAQSGFAVHFVRCGGLPQLLHFHLHLGTQNRGFCEALCAQRLCFRSSKEPQPFGFFRFFDESCFCLDTPDFGVLRLLDEQGFGVHVSGRADAHAFGLYALFLDQHVRLLLLDLNTARLGILSFANECRACLGLSIDLDLHLVQR
mmetsp:Transcript_4265/g.11691  ORF Transcript_4265/g.11691 Transcript_4265/m.11691 type:complete len:214 (+) Transcript_4265:169-810(+)